MVHTCIHYSSSRSMLPCRSMAGYNYEKTKTKTKYKHETCINKFVRITFSYIVLKRGRYSYICIFGDKISESIVVSQL